jgi:molybdopterin molybdotransferase
MDGFAIDGPIRKGQRLVLAGIVAAGDPPSSRLPSGKTLQIMTGAPLPAGADRVVPVEQTRLIDRQVEFLSGVPSGSHIRRRGEVLLQGRVMLESGTALTPGCLSLLATHGCREVAVRRRPRVAVLATGDEVVDPERQPEPGQLRDSHTDFLIAAGRTQGLEFESLGIAPDEPAEILRRIEAGLGFDVLLVSGGVSMGEFDFVESALSKAGCRVLVDSVAVQPGKPLVAARHPGGFVFGLPGNPASVMVCFWLFVRPVLRRLLGFADAFWAGALTGQLEAPLPAAKDRDRFLSAKLRLQEGRILVTPSVAKGSHDTAAFARGTALVRIRAHAPPAGPGERCEILPLVDWPATG